MNKPVNPLTSFYFTGIAAEFADLIGDEATAKLVAKVGGLQLDIPKKASGSKLAGIIGEENAAIIIREFGNGKVVLPQSGMRGTSGRKARAKEMLRAGHSISEVAVAFDLHIRTVSNYKAEMADTAQLDLPFDK